LNDFRGGVVATEDLYHPHGEKGRAHNEGEDSAAKE
jgi:hypothetical protein